MVLGTRVVPFADDDETRLRFVGEAEEQRDGGVRCPIAHADGEGARDRWQVGERDAIPLLVPDGIDRAFGVRSLSEDKALVEHSCVGGAHLGLELVGEAGIVLHRECEVHEVLSGRLEDPVLPQPVRA